MSKSKRTYKASGLNCKLCNTYQPKFRRLGFCGCVVSESDYYTKSIILNRKKTFSKAIKPERIEYLKSKYLLVSYNREKEKVETYSSYKPTVREKKEFYQSWEWKELRFKVLSQYKSTCLLCGATSSNSKICVDHIKPISLYWSKRFELDNLQTLCEDCNMGKSNKDFSDFRDNL